MLFKSITNTTWWISWHIPQNKNLKKKFIYFQIWMKIDHLRQNWFWYQFKGLRIFLDPAYPYFIKDKYLVCGYIKHLVYCYRFLSKWYHQGGCQLSIQRVINSVNAEGIPPDICIFLFLYHLEALIQGPLEVMQRINFHGMHVVNPVHNLLSEVPYNNVSLLFWVFCKQRWIFGYSGTNLLMTDRLGPCDLNGTISIIQFEYWVK